SSAHPHTRTRRTAAPMPRPWRTCSSRASRWHRPAQDPTEPVGPPTHHPDGPASPPGTDHGSHQGRAVRRDPAPPSSGNLKSTRPTRVSVWHLTCLAGGFDSRPPPRGDIVEIRRTPHLLSPPVTCSGPERRGGGCT